MYNCIESNILLEFSSEESLLTVCESWDCKWTVTNHRGLTGTATYY